MTTAGRSSEVLGSPPARPAVLVVDDDPVILELISATLQLEGYQIEVATNGTDALCYLAEASTLPSVVVLDLMLPSMPGPQFAEAMRARPETREIPIIVVSGAVNATEEARKMGASMLVAKPFDLDDLVRAVERAVRAEAS